MDFLCQDGQIFGQVLTEPAGETQTNVWTHRERKSSKKRMDTSEFSYSLNLRFDFSFTWRSRHCAWTSSGRGRPRSGPRPPPSPGRRTWTGWQLSGGRVASGRTWRYGRSVWFWESRHSSRNLPQRMKRSPNLSVCDGNL